MKLLITAFEVFANLQKNPSEEVLNSLNTKNLDITKIIIPVEWDNAYLNIKRKIDEINPDIIIMLGAAPREVFSFEQIARNFHSLTALDNNGQTNKIEQIIENGPETIEASLNPEMFLNIFNSLNIPAEISKDAGDYICNETYYKVRYFHNSIKSIFIHIPTKLALEKVIDFANQGFNQIFKQLLK